MAAGRHKPADVGTGVVCASFAPDGSWLSIGCVHAERGFVELSGLPRFDETQRGKPGATRAYRALMVDPASAWLRLESADGGDRLPVVLSTDDPAAPAWLDPGSGEPRAVEFAARGSRTVTQRWRLGDGRPRVVRVAGRLDVPALAEITEVNPPEPSGATTELVALGRRLEVRAAGLPAVATVDASAGTWRVADGGAVLTVEPELPSLEISVSLWAGSAAPDELTVPPGDPSDWPARAGPPEAPADRLVARALAYVRCCTALALRAGERPILTDHRILPLSWTRDAYYQALLLLATGEAPDADLVADHLRWLWGCERPGGRWVRSHHANGRPKDLAIQADQQLYPLIELADYWRTTGGLPDGVRWAAVVPDAWWTALGLVDPASGLIASEENPADDPLAAPYVASSQLVLWYTALRLAEPGLAGQVGLPAADLLAAADAARAAFARHVVAGGRWAYAVDGRGARVDYHDANDLPAALAPMWGFCRPDDAGWRATTEFAFSPANPAFVPGPHGGLGSRHTPGPWPLGEVQAWIAARAGREREGADAALSRLAEAAFTDGMLPEALPVVGGVRVPVRHWFAWPGAALGALLLLDRRGELGRLAARRTREPARPAVRRT